MLSHSLILYREMIEDASFHSSLKSVANEPVPQFTQFSSRVDEDVVNVESTARHVYAMRLEELPSGVGSPSASSQASMEGSLPVRQGHSVTVTIKDQADLSPLPPPPPRPSLSDTEAAQLRWYDTHTHTVHNQC